MGVHWMLLHLRTVFSHSGERGEAMKRNLFWFCTASGRKFFPAAPTVEMVCIEDIAHALGNICRFGGHCRRHYSVAVHSVGVSMLVHPDLAMQALMHDATEAYMGDMVKPLKEVMPEFEAMEEKLWRLIAERFGLPPTPPTDIEEIRRADWTMLLTERDLLLPPQDEPWFCERLGVKATEREDILKLIDPWPFGLGRPAELFMRRFRQLTNNK